MISRNKHFGGSHADLIKLQEQLMAPSTQSPNAVPNKNTPRKHSKDTEDLQLDQASKVVILQEQVICYCSSFDLNYQDWLGLSENINRLMLALHESLGESSLDC